MRKGDGGERGIAQLSVQLLLRMPVGIAIAVLCQKGIQRGAGECEIERRLLFGIDVEVDEPQVER